MKHVALFFLMALLIICCSKETALECVDQDCLFVLEDISGEILGMECFNQKGIKCTNPDDLSTLYLLPDNLSDTFNEKDQVIFSAKVRSNEVEPEFPDPIFPIEAVFQAEIESIK